MPLNARQQKELSRHCPKVMWHADMAAYSTFRTGGKVEALVEIAHTEQLPGLLIWLHREKIPWKVLGGGSNVLFSSGLHEGLFIRLRQSAATIKCDEPLPGSMGQFFLVQVGAGVHMAALVSWCMQRGLSGLEFMSGIPGTIGGAVYMNAGAFQHSISEKIVRLDCLLSTGKRVSLSAHDICFRYRKSIFPQELGKAVLVECVYLNLQQDTTDEVAGRCRDFVAQRMAKHPGGVASAGSFFKNPAGDFAGRLIEQAGLKECVCGGAMVSPHHCNFIVNHSGASPEDILLLMHTIQEKVYSQSGILLEPEVRIFGEV